MAANVKRKYAVLWIHLEDSSLCSPLGELKKNDGGGEPGEEGCFIPVIHSIPLGSATLTPCLSFTQSLQWSGFTAAAPHSDINNGKAEQSLSKLDWARASGLFCLICKTYSLFLPLPGGSVVNHRFKSHTRQFVACKTCSAVITPKL